MTFLIGYNLKLDDRGGAQPKPPGVLLFGLWIIKNLHITKISVTLGLYVHMYIFRT